MSLNMLRYDTTIPAILLSLLVLGLDNCEKQTDVQTFAMNLNALTNRISNFVKVNNRVYCHLKYYGTALVALLKMFLGNLIQLYQFSFDHLFESRANGYIIKRNRTIELRAKCGAKEIMTDQLKVQDETTFNRTIIH